MIRAFIGIKKIEQISDPPKFTWADWPKLIFLSTILLVIGFTFYRNALSAVATGVLERQDSSHGFFVPFISTYLLWLKWPDLRAATFRADNWLGLIFTGAGIFLFLAGCRSGGFRLATLSFFLLFAGLVILLFGREVFKHVGFPLLFLITMIPFPDVVYAQLAEMMRMMTTWGSVGLLKFVGVPHYREGFDIYLQQQHLHISFSCSGIRYLLSYLVFATAYAFRFKDSNTERLSVVAAAITMAIFGGIIRLSAIFLTTHYIGPMFVTGRPHVLLSWTVFMLVLVVAVAVDQVCSRKRDKDRGARFEDRGSRL